jgi:hypothetical protein
MPALANMRWERFAQGLTQIVAYVEAGYSENAANASTLAKNPQVRERILELSEEASQRKGVTDPIPHLDSVGGVLTPGAAGVTEEWLVKQLMNNVQQAQIAGKFREANTAIEMLGNYFGGLFDKKNPIDQTQKNKAGEGETKKASILDMATQLADNLSRPDDEPDEGDDD